jgi:hypothetical protein
MNVKAIKLGSRTTDFMNFHELYIMEKRKTLVVGASENPTRYSHLALERLTEKGHGIEGIAKKGFFFKDFFIGTEKQPWKDIDTVTMYVGPQHQSEYYDYILSLHPRRIIFNPGAENPEFAKMAEKEGVIPIEACTLVMLSTGQF